MSTQITTKDQPYDDLKKAGRMKLKSDEMMTLNAAIDRAARTVRANPDIFSKYSAGKGVTNYIERIARERNLSPSNLGEYDPKLGVIWLVQGRGTRKWKTPKAKFQHNDKDKKNKKEKSKK